MFRMILMRFIESYFRHRWLYLLPIVLTLGAGVFYIYKSPRQYTAQSAIYVHNQSLLASLTSINNPGYSWLSPAQITYGEIKELIQTDSFVRAVIQKSDLEQNLSGGIADVNQTIMNVREAIWVIPSGDNQIIIGATYNNPQVAVQLVNGVFATYTTWKLNNANTNSDVAQNFFDNLIPTYKSNVDDIRQQLLDYLTKHPSPIVGQRPDIEQVEVNSIQSDLQRAETRYDDALNKLENAKLSALQNQSDINQNYVMVDAPTTPNKPTISLKKMGLNVLIIVTTGILLSVGSVFGSSFLDRSFRSPIDVQQRLNLPMLAMVPDVTPKPKRTRSRKHKANKQKVKSKEKEKIKEFEGKELVPEEEIPIPDEELNAENIEVEVEA
jgi:capsular polysaccharide biosynthesis protein